MRELIEAQKKAQMEALDKNKAIAQESKKEEKKELV